MEKCPKCGKMSLRIENIMGSTRTIYYKCGECCYREKRPYGEDER